MSGISSAQIEIKVGDRRRGFALEAIDFDQSRDELALSIGRAVIDAIYQEVEG